MPRRFTVRRQSCRAPAPSALIRALRSPPLKLLRSAVAATLKGRLAWRSKSAALIYRACRLGGRTIRSIVDCMVAAAALHAQRPLLARDRDFRTIARYTELELVVPAAPASQP